jgi:hypothetical protein
VSEPRIVPPEEARDLVEVAERVGYIAPSKRRDLAHTAAVLGEQREALLEFHRLLGEKAGADIPEADEIWSELGGILGVTNA